MGQSSSSQVEITPVQPSLVSSDHTAEGFLVTLANGTILHIFRLDPGFWGHHVGNSGRIVKRASYDNGQTWTEPSVIYDSQYDDRNIHGGMLANGRILFFFRRYNAVTGVKIDFNSMYSDDGGNNWSEPAPLNTICHASCNQTITYIPSKGYLNALYTNNYVELRFSPDGANWDSIHYAFNFLQNPYIQITESSFTYLGNGKLIGLFRNESATCGSTFYQVSSLDYGATWTTPAITPMADNYFTVSPLNFYDSYHQDLWTIATDRRGYCGPQHPHSLSRIYIYRNNPEDLLTNPSSYSLFDTIGRPFPNNYRFYGYPITTRMANGNYLVIFTESYRKTNYLEGANFYQFEIHYQPRPLQQILLNQGWNLLSTNILPSNSSIENVMHPARDKVVLIKNDNGGIYWPNFRINQIGTLDPTKGYLGLTNQATNLRVVGQEIQLDTTPVFLRQGWSFAGYLKKNPSPISSIMANVEQNILLVKDGFGHIYWPGFGIDQIGDMVPGRGYSASMLTASYLYYPSDTVISSKLSPGVSAVPVFFKREYVSDRSMVLGIPLEAWPSIPETGSEIGVFSRDGILAGAGVFEGSAMAITLWGEDVLNDGHDGLMEGESFFLKIRSTSGEVKPLVIESVKSGSLLYSSNGVTVIEKFRSNIAPSQSAGTLRISPNPTDAFAELSIDGVESFMPEIQVYDISGRNVTDLVPTLGSAGNKTWVDLTKLPSGSYQVVCEVLGGGRLSQVLLRQ